MSAENEVRAVSARFYDALSRMANGEKGTMADVWIDHPNVMTMHPIGGREEGWEAVSASFDGVASAAEGGEVRIEEQRIDVTRNGEGDVAREVGVERGYIVMGGERVEVDGRVTNIYQRGDDGWVMVHHHADPSPAMIDVVQKMRAGD